MAEARRVFDGIREPDVVSWSSLILGYAGNGEGQAALEMFSRMRAAAACAPNAVTYMAALKACGCIGPVALERGREIHLEIGSNTNDFVQNALIGMYAKCCSMAEARKVFDNLQRPRLMDWNALILGYAENGESLAALEMFSKMNASDGCAPSSITFVAALKACRSLATSGDIKGCLERGREIHKQIGCHLNTFVQNTLIDMYAKAGCLSEARQVFESIKKRDVVSWNALLNGHAENKEGQAALDMFFMMRAARECEPDSVTYIAALKSCTSLAVNGDDYEKKQALEQGKRIHSEIGCQSNLYMLNTLIDMYAKCGSMKDARFVFDSLPNPDVVSWNALLIGYVENGEGTAVLELFSRMKSSKECLPDAITYVAALKACTSLGKECLTRVKEIHSEVGSHMSLYVESTLVDMYAKGGSMSQALKVFEGMQNPDAVAWSAIIMGYAENGEGYAALSMFNRMVDSGCAPSHVTYMAALKACALIGALALGRKLHSEMREFTTYVVTCLVDCYTKCGSIGEACEVFDKHPRQRNVPTWTAMLAGYGSFGDAASALNLFQAMQDIGLQPSSVTLLCMLMCLNHAGLVARAREFFEAMPTKFGIAPSLMHYNCMVDALGRANQLQEAVTMVRGMPCHPDAVTWMTLLVVSHKWKDLEIGRLAFRSLVKVDKHNASAYVLMGQIYGSRGMQQEQDKLLQSRTLHI